VSSDLSIEKGILIAQKAINAVRGESNLNAIFAFYAVTQIYVEDMPPDVKHLFKTEVEAIKKHIVAERGDA
jgi:hypothetical protein